MSASDNASLTALRCTELPFGAPFSGKQSGKTFCGGMSAASVPVARNAGCSSFCSSNTDGNESERVIPYYPPPNQTPLSQARRTMIANAPEKTKVCRTCWTRKDLSNFRHIDKAKGRRHPECGECRRTKIQEARQKTRRGALNRADEGEDRAINATGGNTCCSGASLFIVCRVAEIRRKCDRSILADTKHTLFCPRRRTIESARTATAGSLKSPCPHHPLPRRISRLLATKSNRPSGLLRLVSS